MICLMNLMKEIKMEDTTQQFEKDGIAYLIMSKELFDLRIKAAYTNGELNAYQNISDGIDKLRGDD